MSTLKAPSYANVLTNAISPTSSSTSNWKPLARQSLESQVKELSHPAPQSLILTAALQLLAPLNSHSDVFLMTRSYMQNWLIWAFHEVVPKTEKQRVQTAIRLAADRLGLRPPSFHSKYTDPGPINNSDLSIEGFSLLLKPNVVVRDGTQERLAGQGNVDDLLPRVRSLPNPSNGEDSYDQSMNEGENIDVEGDEILCCAVPAKFYEVCCLL